MEDSVGVLICGPYPYRHQDLSIGVATVIRDLRRGFMAHEPEASISVLAGSKEIKKPIERHGRTYYLKQPRHKIGSVYLSGYPLRIRRALRELRFDVLNAHTSDFGWYGLEMREKLIYTLHGIHLEEGKHINAYKRPFWNLLYTKRQAKMLKEIRYLISISPFLRSIADEMTSARVFEIPNPVDDAYFEVEDEKREGQMLCMGTISRLKNLLVLIRALKLVRKEVANFKLAVAGRITDRTYYAGISEFIRKNNLENEVEFLGVIGDAQKYDELSKMSFLVLPSLQEIAPCVIVESFAVAKPVVASGIGGIPYMMDNGRNGLLTNPRDEKDLASKMIYFLQNPKEAETMGKNAKEYAEKNHALRNVVHLYKRAYDTVVDSL